MNANDGYVKVRLLTRTANRAVLVHINKTFSPKSRANQSSSRLGINLLFSI